MPVLLLVAMYIGGAGELSCERQTAKGHKIVVILMSCLENQGIPTTTQPADIHSKEVPERRIMDVRSAGNIWWQNSDLSSRKPHMVRAMTAAQYSHLIGSWKLLNLRNNFPLTSPLSIFISFCCLKNLSGMPVPSDKPLSIITNYNWQATLTMPRTVSLFSITLRRTTTIFMVDSNLTMVQGGLRHIDGSTTITNRDAFNIENTVTEQQLPPTASLIVGSEGMVLLWDLTHLEHWFNSAQTTLVSPDPSAARQTHDTDRTTTGKRQISIHVWNWHLQVVRVC